MHHKTRYPLILFLLSLLLLTGCSRQTADPALTDFPQAITLLGKPRSEITSLLGAEYQRFQAHPEIGETAMLASDKYKTANGLSLPFVHLFFKTEGADAALDSIQYTFSYRNLKEAQAVCDFYMSQQAALTEHMGRTSDFQDGVLPASLTEEILAKQDDYCEWWSLEEQESSLPNYTLSICCRITIAEEYIYITLYTNESYQSFPA